MARETQGGGGTSSEGEASPESEDRARLSNREKQAQQHTLEALAQRLASLRPHELDVLDLDDDLRGALDALRPLSGSARNRQAKVVHGLLRDDDPEALSRRLDRGGPSSYHPTPSGDPGPLAHWLARLLDEGDPAVEALLERSPTADRQQLRQLVRTARKTPAGAASRRARRALERLIGELRPEP
jgi:ribosome-associated protein